MSDFASTWPNATVNPDGNSDNNQPPEPGDYDVSIQSAKAFTSKAGNEIMLVEFRVLDTGYTWADVRGFKSAGAAKAAKGLAMSLGVAVDDIGSLEALDGALNGAVGGYFRVRVVQNGEFRNVYVNERLSGLAPVSDVPEGDVPTHAQTTDGEDIPF